MYWSDIYFGWLRPVQQKKFDTPWCSGYDVCLHICLTIKKVPGLSPIRTTCLAPPVGHNTTCVGSLGYSLLSSKLGLGQSQLWQILWSSVLTSRHSHIVFSSHACRRSPLCDCALNFQCQSGWRPQPYDLLQALTTSHFFRYIRCPYILPLSDLFCCFCMPLLNIRVCVCVVPIPLWLHLFCFFFLFLQEIDKYN